MILEMNLDRQKQEQTVILASVLICPYALLQTDRGPSLKPSSWRRPWPPERRPADWILPSNSRDAMVSRSKRSEVALVWLVIPWPTFPLRASMQGCSGAAEMLYRRGRRWIDDLITWGKGNGHGKRRRRRWFRCCLDQSGGIVQSWGFPRSKHKKKNYIEYFDTCMEY